MRPLAGPWHEWVGLYGSGEQAVIRLAEESDGSERVRLAWEQGRLVEAGSGTQHRS
ncbi:hypothetical protein [Streptomyces sp. NPDC001137]|uniref:hypothetical protein n=1 Tax=Streptomyces sp. NPDC001137 TaxID=3154378 RepID=UPI0033198544